MDFEIKWVEEAWEEFEIVVSYLNNYWSPNIASDFRIHALKRIKLLSANPFLGRKAAGRKNLRKFTINRQNTVYYEIAGDEIYILRFFDTRQHPRKLRFRKR